MTNKKETMTCDAGFLCNKLIYLNEILYRVSYIYYIQKSLGGHTILEAGPEDEAGVVDGGPCPCWP